MSNQIKSTDTLHIVRCSIGPEVYGLDTSWVLSIQRVDRLRRVSAKGAGNTGFVGWLSSRPSDIPVFSLTTRLGQEESISLQKDLLQRIIILPAPAPAGQNKNKEDHLWALLVDQVSPVFEISGERFHPLPAMTINPKRNYFEGVIRTDKGLLLFLSPEWLHPDTSLYIDGVIEKPHSLEAQLNAHLKQVEADQQKSPSKNERAVVEISQPQDIRTSNGKVTRSKQGRLVTFVTDNLQVNGFPMIYGLSITQVVEVLYPLPLIPVPAAPEYVLGLVNWRNRVVPIIDLNARLGLVSTDAVTLTNPSRLIIVRGLNDNELVGFFIQPTMRTVELPIPHRPLTQDVAVDPSGVWGIFQLNEETLIVPNIQDILL